MNNTMLLILFFCLSFESKAENGTVKNLNINTKVEKCIIAAAKFHGVNHKLLRAILNLESNLNPDAINENTDGSIDIGMGQINSVHFPELAKWGITPEKLKNPCISSYVAAWHLRKGITKYGYNWFGVAAYHSITPEHNYKYQILIYNEMIQSGAIRGEKMKLPTLNTKLNQLQSEHRTNTNSIRDAPQVP